MLAFWYRSAIARVVGVACFQCAACAVLCCVVLVLLLLDGAEPGRLFDEKRRVGWQQCVIAVADFAHVRVVFFRYRTLSRAVSREQFSDLFRACCFEFCAQLSCYFASLARVQFEANPTELSCLPIVH